MTLLSLLTAVGSAALTLFVMGRPRMGSPKTLAAGGFMAAGISGMH